MEIGQTSPRVNVCDAQVLFTIQWNKNSYIHHIRNVNDKLQCNRCFLIAICFHSLPTSQLQRMETKSDNNRPK